LEKQPSKDKERRDTTKIKSCISFIDGCNEKSRVNLD